MKKSPNKILNPITGHFVKEEGKIGQMLVRQRKFDDKLFKDNMSNMSYDIKDYIRQYTSTKLFDTKDIKHKSLDELYRVLMWNYVMFFKEPKDKWFNELLLKKMNTFKEYETDRLTNDNIDYWTTTIKEQLLFKPFYTIKPSRDQYVDVIYDKPLTVPFVGWQIPNIKKNLY